MSLPAISPSQLSPETLEKVLLGGDLARLQPSERVSYYKNVCESLGFNPLTRPFDYLLLNNKLVLYPNKGGGEQLRKINNVSIKITAREVLGEVYVVTAQARLPEGREDESTGAVPITNLRGNDLANAYLRCETKAKRRVTLSICGLNMVDDSEIDSIKDAKRVSHEEAESLPEKSEEKKPFDKSPTNPGDYRPTFGKFGGIRLAEIDPNELGSYCQYIVREAEKKGHEIRGQVKEFLEMAGEFAPVYEADLSCSFEDNFPGAS